ncbi:MAG TPA: GNAT family N-acetyltransferase, partial [Gammaproteobacteria bacterium]|nr:GNAT family N-acetyltransferase [Gammaproteobacteria bacterium]
RTLQIGRVTNHLIGKTVEVRAGSPIPYKLLTVLNCELKQTDFIRAYLYALMARRPQQRRIPAMPIEAVNQTRASAHQIVELYDLLYEQKEFIIRENSTYVVLLCQQQQLKDLGPPYDVSFSVLKDEIGRLRELTFREVGEGSGLTRDLDQFDEYYFHLTLWDRTHKQLIGAYRIAFTEDIFPQYGVSGLYTAVQFDYDPLFFTTLGPAVELSRAFIIKAHQKNHLSLSTLLGAVSAMLKLRPNVRSFFGAVSISNEFQSISKKLIIEYLTRHHGHSTLSHLLKPKNPPQLETHLPDVEWQRLVATVQDLSLLNMVVSGIEGEGKSVPPLISAYIS